MEEKEKKPRGRKKKEQPKEIKVTVLYGEKRLVDCMKSILNRVKPEDFRDK